MYRMKKSLLFIGVLVIASFMWMPNIFASSVKINGGVTDIYETGGEGSATFNKETNTLTLDNYNNDSIIFEGFNEETVNVILKGTNTIKSTTGYVEDVYTTAFGYDDADEDDKVTLNITGEDNSKLNIDGYYMGIYIHEGLINISNVDIDAKDVHYTLIYNEFGDLISIKDSKIKAVGINYVIMDDFHSITLDNIEYTSENTGSFDFWSANTLTVKNSKFNVLNSSELFYSKTLTIDDSFIKSDNGVYLMSSENLTINNSKIDANVIGLALTAYNYLHIDNSDVTIVSSDGAVLNIQADDLINFDEVVVYNNLDMLETSYLKTKVEISGIGYIYGYFIEEPTRVYSFEEIDSIAALAAKELHLVARHKLSFDANGGTGEMNDVLVSGEYTLPTSTFTAPEGKVFAGWSLTNNGDIIDKVTVNNNLTVHAIWKSAEEEIKNPKTGDNIGMYIMIGFISMIAPAAIILERKREN